MGFTVYLRRRKGGCFTGGEAAFFIFSFAGSEKYTAEIEP
jgi:hypothetical protein